MGTAPFENEIGDGNTGLTPWSAFVDVTETVRTGMAELDQHVQRDAHHCIDRLAALGIHTADPPLPLEHRLKRRRDQVIADACNRFVSL
jgi:hypothetical protein